jgi:ubiquinone/menaquinone biosynthesis C-methylase UbiE
MSDRRARTRARLQLTRLAIGGWAAQALFAANELGVFDLLAERSTMTADEVSAALGADPDATARLLGSLVAADLVVGDGVGFRNGLAASEFLVARTPESMHTWVSLIGRWNQTFGQLATSVKTGKPAEVPEEHLGGSTDYTRDFIIGMHDYAIGPGRELARHLDLSGRHQLLDLGGGPGTYSLLLAEANPSLTCTVFDLSEVVAIADEVIREHGDPSRISTLAGDYHHDVLPSGYDVVLISNVLHQEDWETCQRILRGAFAALDPGGMVVVHAMFLNDRGDGPLWPALHNLLMLLVYRGGRAYSVQQTCQMLTDVGFVGPAARQMSVFNAGSFVVATKP